MKVGCVLGIGMAALTMAGCAERKDLKAPCTAALSIPGPQSLTAFAPVVTPPAETQAQFASIPNKPATVGQAHVFGPGATSCGLMQSINK